MALFLTIVYVVLTFLSVSESFPALEQYRIQLILGIAGTVATLPVLFRRQFVFQRHVLLMVGFTAIVLLSWLPHGWVGGVTVSAREFLPLGTVFFLAAFNIRSLANLRLLRLVILGVVLYLVGRGLSDYFRNPDNSPFVLIQNEGGLTIYRLQGQGLLGDPNAFAQFLMATLPLLFVGFKTRGWTARICLILPMAALTLTAIFFTHSRGALVGLVVLLGVLVRRRFQFATGSLASIAAGAALLAVGFTGGRSISVSGGTDRLDIWSDGLGLFLHSPIWGIGYNGFADQLTYTAHNSFLLCAAELGLVGYFFWMALVIVSAWQLNRIAQSDAEEDSTSQLREWANALLLSLVAFLTPGFFISETYAPMLYLLLGISAAVVRMEVERTGDELLPEDNHWVRKTGLACVGSLALIYVMVRLRAV